MQFYKRSNIFWGIFILAFVVQVGQLTIAGCSHTSPYYRSEIPVTERQDVLTEHALAYRVLLLGDGGEPKPDEPVLKTLQAWAEKNPEKTSAVFLGDNMYPEGMTARKRHEAEFRLGPQLAVVKAAQTHGLFIPGNHDWASGKETGYRALLAQEEFINKTLPREPNFLPRGGLPGPVQVDLPADAPVVRLIVLDTQWWLHKHEKPKQSEEGVIDSLKTMLDTELPIIVVGHHPLETYGMHGGFFDWKVHLFPARTVKKWLWVPVPLLGSVYPLGRWHLFRSEQDINGARNKHMVSELNAAFATAKRTPLLIYASGHDHSLQVLNGAATDYLLVSGLASSEKATPVSHGESTLFAHEHAGFMAVDFLQNGKVLLRVVEPGRKEVLFHHWLIGN